MRQHYIPPRQERFSLLLDIGLAVVIGVALAAAIVY